MKLLDAAALCRKLVPEDSVEAFLADHRQELFPDELFADLFPSGRGRPSVPSDVIATVMVLQALEGLSDRDAARALRDRISWKVASGLALDDTGFHHSVLTYWRTRLRSSERPERIFDAVRAVVDATGVLKGKTGRALDSTLLDDAVATQDTVTQLISLIRRVRREVPVAATVDLLAHDYDAGAKPLIAWDDAVAKEQLVSALVNDALCLIDATESSELTASQQNAVGLLALVAGQDVEPADGEGRWRIARAVPPDRVISVVDPEARHMHKSRSSYRDGYKAHICVEPETGLVTACSLTPRKRRRRASGRGPDRRRRRRAGGARRLCLRLRRGPSRSGKGRASGDDQTDPASTGHPRRVHAGRLHHRRRQGCRHLSRGDHGVDHPTWQRRVRCEMPRMPASGPMHQLDEGTDDQGPPTPRSDAGRPATGPNRAVPGLLPTTSTDGGTFARLVGRTGPPPGPLPRRVAQPTRPI